MTQADCLIIFAKNLEFGKVKTRLAATLGNKKAFDIYNDLLSYTHSVTHQLTCAKIIYYSEYIMHNDRWNEYGKAQQQGNDLGIKMINALSDTFSKGFHKAVIIGTDCFEITPFIIEEAFEKLEDNDIVIGPAADGGYYLIGMKKMYPSLFNNIAWSTDTVFKSSLSICNGLNLNCFILDVLHDVDEEKDL